MYECKETAERPSKDRRRGDGLSVVNELFALSCDVNLIFLLIFNTLRQFQRRRQEPTKKERRWKGDGIIKQRHLVCPANLMSERGHLCRRLQPYPRRAEEGRRDAHILSVVNWHNEIWPTGTMKNIQLTQWNLANWHNKTKIITL